MLWGVTRTIVELNSDIEYSYLGEPGEISGSFLTHKTATKKKCKHNK